MAGRVQFRGRGRCSNPKPISEPEPISIPSQLKYYPSKWDKFKRVLMDMSFLAMSDHHDVADVYQTKYKHDRIIKMYGIPIS